jgi:hypothetical protein
MDGYVNIGQRDGKDRELGTNQDVSRRDVGQELGVEGIRVGRVVGGEEWLEARG